MARILLIGLMLLAGGTVANRGTKPTSTGFQRPVVADGAPVCFPEPHGGCGQTTL